MNQIQREEDSKARRRVIFWLASGLGAFIALGLLGLGVTDLAARASTNSSYDASSEEIATKGLIVNPAAVINKLSAEEAAKHPSSTRPADYSPTSPPASDPKPPHVPGPTPTPDPTPAPSDDTNHDGHPDNDGHSHADDDTASKEVPSSQDS